MPRIERIPHPVPGGRAADSARGKNLQTHPCLVLVFVRETPLKNQDDDEDENEDELHPRGFPHRRNMGLARLGELKFTDAEDKTGGRRGMTTPKKTKTDGDVFGTAEVLKLVVQKLASQSLLFGMAMFVILIGAWKVSQGSLPLVFALLFVFVAALAGYLFVEQKTKVEQQDPATMSRVNGGKMKDISNPTSTFKVELWTAPAPAEGARDITVSTRKKKAGYRTGQKIVVGFRTSRDCHLTLLNIGTSGKLTVLFPNSLHPDNFIQAGRDYRIPGEDDDFEYELQGPAGVEKLKAVATVKKVTLLESNFAPDGSLFRTVDAVAGARDIGVIKKKCAEVPPDEWAEDACEFSVA